MKLHRFFINPEFIQGKNIAISDKNLLLQLKNVLRLKIGSEVIFLDNSGKEYKTVIESLSDLGIKGRIIEIAENKNEPELKIALYQSLCKKDKFEWVLQKGTEIGISEFIPIITERTEKLGLDFERCGKILKESAEQSERGIIPKLSEITDFSKAIKSAAGEKILLDRSGKSMKFYALNPKTYTLNVFVGPEGGFTDEELKLAKENSVKIISLGSRILRTETAGLVAAAILLLK